MTEGEMLHGRDLSDRIRLICAEDEVDCAVAFWGGLIRDDLFPRWSEQTVRIVCDISMGCNSQKSLRRYGAPDNEHLMVLDGLHAKVFVSRAGAIVGSANASANGVGTTNKDPANHEAGVFFSRDSLGWTAAKRFFDECLKDSVVLNSAQLDRAWLAARDPGPIVGPAGTESASVLDRVIGYNVAFSDTIIFSEDVEIEDEELVELDSAYEEAEQAEFFEPSDREFIIVSPETDIAQQLSSVILYWRGGRARIIAYVDVVYVRVDNRLALYGREDWRGYWKARDMIAPKRRGALALDRQRIEEIRGGLWALTSAQLLDELQTLRERNWAG